MNDRGAFPWFTVTILAICALTALIIAPTVVFWAVVFVCISAILIGVYALSSEERSARAVQMYRQMRTIR